MTVIGGAVRWSQSSTKPTFQTRGMSRDAILYFINIIYYFSQTSQLRFKIFGLSVVDGDHLPANRFYHTTTVYRIPTCKRIWYSSFSQGSQTRD